MVLNELIEKYSINVISRNTRIAVEYLEALLERNCSKLKRVQAFGFISILEREYGVDLSALKKECRDYFDSNPDSGVVLEGKDIPIFATSKEDDEEPKKQPEDEKQIRIKEHLNKIVIALVVVIVAYGSWQFFVPKGFSDTNTTVELSEESSNAKESNESKKSFFDSVIAMFKGDDKNNTEKEPKKEEETKKAKNEKKSWEEESKPKKVAKKETKKEQTTKKETKRESQDSIESKIIEQVKKEEAKKAETPQEDDTQISDLISNATAGVDDIVDDSQIDITDTLDTQVPSMAEDDTKAQAEPEPEPTPEPKKVEKKPKKEKATKGKFKTITFHPRAKVWAGYTNLTTMRRAVATGADDIKLDVSKDSYILATGHGRVEFLSGNKELLKLGDGKKHFFKITKNGVKEISHEEFQKLNKSKVW